jgi:hypothetical protein
MQGKCMCEWSFSRTGRFNPKGKKAQWSLDMGLGGSQNGSSCCEKEKTFLACVENLNTIPYPGSPCHQKIFKMKVMDRTETCILYHLQKSVWCAFSESSNWVGAVWTELNWPDSFSEGPHCQYEILSKSVRCFRRCNMRTDGHMKIYMISQLRDLLYPFCWKNA